MKKKSTNQKSGLWTAGFGEIGATLKALQDHGVTLEHLARLRAEPEYAKRVAEYILRGGVDGSVHHKLARALMGKNFFGIEDWATLHGANFSHKQLRQVAEFQWGEDVLASTCPLCGKQVLDCHFAFLGLDRINGDQLNIFKLIEFHPAIGYPIFRSYDNTKRNYLTEIIMEFAWYVLHIDIVPGSAKKTFEKQEAMLPAEYEIPSLIAEIAKDLFLFKKNGPIQMFGLYRRCADINQHGERVCVSCYDSGEIGFNDLVFDQSTFDSVYVAASRKPGV